MIDPDKVKALELAVQNGGTHAEVVERATAFHSFLTGESTAKPKAATAGTTGTTGKPAAAGAGTGTAGKPTTAPKATPATGTKPAAAAAGAAKPAATGAAKSAEPKGDTKDPKGTYSFDDVKVALQKVMKSVPGDNDKHDKGRKLAYDILAAKGGGVKGVRDLKPPLYDAVVNACTEAVKPKAVAAATAPVEDDFGMPIDTSGASAADSGDDPPEGGSGEDA